MRFLKEAATKDGKKCTIRNAVAKDASQVLKVNYVTHSETDFLQSYPEECSLDSQSEEIVLLNLENSKESIILVAVVDGDIVGTAFVKPMGIKAKIKHRADFGLGIVQAYCHQGIGKLLIESCIECAKQMGYQQMELIAVADNVYAIDLYKKFNFIEYGRNPKGFWSRTSGWQEIVLMRLELL